LFELSSRSKIDFSGFRRKIPSFASKIKFRRNSFFIRALQFPPEGWLRISLANSSITWLQIMPNGRVILRAMGDFGHLPPEKISFC